MRDSHILSFKCLFLSSTYLSRQVKAFSVCHRIFVVVLAKPLLIFVIVFFNNIVFKRNAMITKLKLIYAIKKYGKRSNQNYSLCVVERSEAHNWIVLIYQESQPACPWCMSHILYRNVNVREKEKERHMDKFYAKETKTA